MFGRFYNVSRINNSLSSNVSMSQTMLFGNAQFLTRSPFTYSRSISLMGWFQQRKERNAQLASCTPLQRALIQKEALNYLLTKAPFYWRFIYFRPKRSTQQVDSLVIYEKAAAHANSPGFKELSLPAGFHSWVKLVFLHLWMLEWRFRYVNDLRDGNRILSSVIEYFWEDLENGIADSLNTRNPMIIVRYSKRYLSMWYAAALSYDVGYIKGDASLADALWRNLYDKNPDVSIAEIHQMVKYIRTEIFRIIAIPNNIILSAEFDWKLLELQEKNKQSQ